ncbi:MAG: hypothetical protein IJ193_00280 [Bacilli bacterium]|nr:hypothetical protein [Bacilli bacterium]
MKIKEPYFIRRVDYNIMKNLYPLKETLEQRKKILQKYRQLEKELSDAEESKDLEAQIRIRKQILEDKDFDVNPSERYYENSIDVIKRLEKELNAKKEKAEPKSQTPEQKSISDAKEKEKAATVPMGAPTSKTKEKEKKKKGVKEEVAVELQTPSEKIVEAVQEGVNNGTMTATVSTTPQLYYAVDENGHIVYDQYGQPIMFTEPLVWSWATKTWRKAA